MSQAKYNKFFEKYSNYIQKYSKYIRKYKHKHIDIYRVLETFGVTDPCLQHAVKKLILAGVRTGDKSKEKDVEEAIDSCTRWLMMRAEEELVDLEG